jgi:hypothetical protein
MVRGRRSLNLVTAGAIVLGEAMRQTCAFERLESGREPSGDDVEQEDE